MDTCLMKWVYVRACVYCVTKYFGQFLKFGHEYTQCGSKSNN